MVAKLPPETMESPRIFNRSDVGFLLYREGDPVSLSVEVRGRPQPHVTWYMDNKPLVPSLDYMIRSRQEVHSLYISRVTEYVNKGITVEAKNQAGSTEYKFDLKVYTLRLNKNVTVQREVRDRSKSRERDKDQTSEPTQTNLKRYQTLPLNRTCKAGYLQIRSTPRRTTSAVSDYQSNTEAKFTPKIQQTSAYNQPRLSASLPRATSHQSCSVASTADSGFSEASSLAPSTPSVLRIDEDDAEDASEASPVYPKLPPLAVAEDDSLSLSSLEGDEPEICIKSNTVSYTKPLKESSEVAITKQNINNGGPVLQKDVAAKEATAKDAPAKAIDVRQPLTSHEKQAKVVSDDDVATLSSSKTEDVTEEPIPSVKAHQQMKEISPNVFLFPDVSRKPKQTIITKDTYSLPAVNKQSAETELFTTGTKPLAAETEKKTKTPAAVTTTTDIPKKSQEKEKTHAPEKHKIFNFFKHRDRKNSISDNQTRNGEANKESKVKAGGENDSLSSSESHPKKGHRRNSSLSFFDRTKIAFQNMRTPTAKEEDMVAEFMGRKDKDEEPRKKRNKKFLSLHKTTEDEDAVLHVTGSGCLGPQHISKSHSKPREYLTLTAIKKKFKWGKSTPEKQPEPEPVSPPWAQQYVGDVAVEQDEGKYDDPPPPYEGMTRSPPIENFEEAAQDDVTISELNSNKHRHRVRFSDTQLETTNYYYVSDSDLSATSVDTLTAEESGLRDSAENDPDAKAVEKTSNRQRMMLAGLGKSIGGVGSDGDGFFLNKGITDEGCMFSFWSDRKSATSSPRLFRKPYAYDIIEPDGNSKPTQSDGVSPTEIDCKIFYGQTGKRPNLKPLFDQNNVPLVEMKVKRYTIDDIEKTIEDSPQQKQNSNDTVKRTAREESTALKSRDEIANKVHLNAQVHGSDNSDTTSSESINDSGYFQGSFDGENSDCARSHIDNKVGAVSVLERSLECEVGEITPCFVGKSLAFHNTSNQEVHTASVHYLGSDSNSEACDSELLSETQYVGDREANVCQEESTSKDSESPGHPPLKQSHSISSDIIEVGQLTSNITDVPFTAEITPTCQVIGNYVDDSGVYKDIPVQFRRKTSTPEVAQAMAPADDSDDSDDTSTLIMSDSSCMLAKQSSESLQDELAQLTKDTKCIAETATDTNTDDYNSQGGYESSDEAEGCSESDSNSCSLLDNYNNSNSNESLLDIVDEETFLNNVKIDPENVKRDSDASDCDISTCSSSGESLSIIYEEQTAKLSTIEEVSSAPEQSDQSDNGAAGNLVHRKKKQNKPVEKQHKNRLSLLKHKVLPTKNGMKRAAFACIAVVVFLTVTVAFIHMMESHLYS